MFVSRRETNSELFTTLTVTLFGFSNLTERLKFYKFYGALG